MRIGMKVLPLLFWIIIASLDATETTQDPKTLDESPRGQNILALFKMKKLFALSVDELLSLKQYYSEYLALKQRYGSSHE